MSGSFTAETGLFFNKGGHAVLLYFRGLAMNRRELMDDFCPECGTGFEPKCDAYPNGRILRLSRDYPFNPECETCIQRGHERFRELGRTAALKIEKQIIESVFE